MKLYFFCRSLYLKNSLYLVSVFSDEEVIIGVIWIWGVICLWVFMMDFKLVVYGLFVDVLFWFIVFKLLVEFLSWFKVFECGIFFCIFMFVIKNCKVYVSIGYCYGMKFKN